MPIEPRLHAASARNLFLAAILAFAVGLVALGGAEAAPKQPKCGDTITVDTTLHKDLVNCPNNGIVIGAGGITLDLNGHLIDGDGTEASGCNPNSEICDSGIVDDGHDGTTVKHGRVREFGVGVLFGTSTAGRVRHNRVLGVSSVRNQFLGIGIFSSVRSLVQNSSGSSSVARRDAVGIALGDSDHVRILHNSFGGNSDHGIFVAESTHSLIKGNRVSRTKTAIFLLDSDRNRVRRNRSVRATEGILVDNGMHNAITRNRVSRAGGGKGREGIAIEAGRRNLIAHNVVVDVRGFGIRLGLSRPPRGTAHNIVSRNLVRGSGEDGFLVKTKAHHNLLKGNTAIGTGDDGFDVEGRTSKLTGNRAVRNHDLGIEAVRGVIDGGGNKAKDNGDPRQCTHIACR